MEGNGEIGTLIREPSALRTETALPTKSLICGLRPSSGEPYCMEHILSNTELKAAVGQYQTISCVSCIVAIIFDSVFQRKDSVFLPATTRLIIEHILENFYAITNFVESFVIISYGHNV